MQSGRPFALLKGRLKNLPADLVRAARPGWLKRPSLAKPTCRGDSSLRSE
jgi:hypothetical protein